MTSILRSDLLSPSPLRPSTADRRHHKPPCRFLCRPGRHFPVHSNPLFAANRLSGRHLPIFVATSTAPAANAVPPKNGTYTVGDFMTTKDELHVVKSSTTVDEALQMLVANRITGFPVIDDDWNLVGLVSDYDLLALDSISGTGSTEIDMFPEVDRTWKTFKQVQNLLSKTNGKVVGDVMTPAPMVVDQSTNLEEAARLLLETKYRRLPVVDDAGRLVGIITRGNVVRAALQIKRSMGVV